MNQVSERPGTGRAPVAASHDGRHQRSQRSREGVVDALLDLLSAGHVPSTREIAAKAGMTERTLFNLFANKRELLWTAVTRFRQRALARLPETPRRGSLEQRVQRFVRDVAPFLDDYATVRWAALTYGDVIPDMDRGVVHTALLDRLTSLLEEAGGGWPDSEMMHALRALVDPLIWRQLRVHQRLGRRRAAGVLARMILAVLCEPVAG